MVFLRVFHLLLLLGHIISKFKGIFYHCYDDDIQLYMSFGHNESEKVTVSLCCLSAIKAWMANNFLPLNTEKSEDLVITFNSIALIGSPVKLGRYHLHFSGSHPIDCGMIMRFTLLITS